MTISEGSADPFDRDRIEAIAARLALRQPNKEALESIASEMVQHYDIDRNSPPFEAVLDSATGVGKTYILAAAIEYFATEGVRNFAIITPGRTILEKTVANFTPGHPKSLLGGMEVRPVVITSENFDTAVMRAVMDDSDQVKLYIFTVQALTKPQTKLGRKTHKYQEGLGAKFYEHLQSRDDLTVFADEHHVYYGPAFSAAIRNLVPWVLIGLTATPHRKTPPEQIIYRYPLSAAIADKLVKTPVLVGRKDDRTDPETKLSDGVRLLEFKERAITRWCQEAGGDPIHPVMLVIAPNIAEAEELEQIIMNPSFAGGRYADAVLTVHSHAPDEALAQLATLEEPDSPYRIVISVGMLKEGWDVKNVYVIASMRASVSEILTEQTLGRGLRLPFGRYTGIELLDTLEVLGHERYEDLLRKADVLNEQFIDRRTRAVLRKNAEGQLVSVPETTTVVAPIIMGADENTTESLIGSSEPATVPAETGKPVIESLEDYTKRAEESVNKLQVTLPPRPGLPTLRIPQLTMTPVKNTFSLADITERTAFRELGTRVAADPADNLRRVTVTARVIQGPDGLRRTELVRARAVDRVASPARLFPLQDLRRELLMQVLGAPVVPARPNERQPAADIVDAFLKGVGPQPEKILSGYLDRAAAGLIQLITEEHRKFVANPSCGEVLELQEFVTVRRGQSETSTDRFGKFRKDIGYEGYQKSLYAQDWFDSSTERDVANILEDEEAIVFWVRLQRGDLPILWAGAKTYHPDFVAVDRDDTHWIVEVKMDKEMTSRDVQRKRDAALRWANHVSADEKVGTRWHYLLVSETNVKAAKGSWEALKGFGDY